ncbi:MAG: lysoplasmalogenase family protein [Sphingomonadales bacterium]|jgi:uncharacterized membrane protein YhhN
MTAALPVSPLAGLPPRFLAGLVLALVAGSAFLLAAPLTDDGVRVALKGSGVALLALAALQLPVPGARWLAAIMALGAMGDVLLDIKFLAGAISFAAAHLVGISFYAQHRRAGADRLVPGLILAWGLIMPFALIPVGDDLWPALIYALLLTLMAASLWCSRFPRLAALGALAFIASDTLLVLRLGGGALLGGSADGALVWILYFGGQWLITLGVGRGLLARARSSPHASLVPSSA